MYLMPKITVNEIRTVQALNVTTTMDTNFSLEKFELLKNAHLKQNRELIRANINYASRIHKLENTVSTLKFENLELRTRLIHVERQLKLKEERLGMILQQLFSEEEEKEETQIQAVEGRGDSNIDPVAIATVVKRHQLLDIRSVSPKRWNEGIEENQRLQRELHIMSTMNEDDDGDDKPPLKKKRTDSIESVSTPSSSNTVGLFNNDMSIIRNSNNKENGSTVQSQDQLIPTERGCVLNNSAMCFITMTEEEQVESLDSSDDDMMGYSNEPPLSPGSELLSEQQQCEQEEQQQQQKMLIPMGNKKNMIGMSDSNNIDVNASKGQEEKTMGQKNQEGRNIVNGDAKLQNSWINNQRITSTDNTHAAANVSLCSNKRFRTPKNYKLPSVKKKLRQGDPFTFDYQNTSLRPSSSQ